MNQPRRQLGVRQIQQLLECPPFFQAGGLQAGVAIALQQYVQFLHSPPAAPVESAVFSVHF